MALKIQHSRVHPVPLPSPSKAGDDDDEEKQSKGRGLSFKKKRKKKPENEDEDNDDFKIKRPKTFREKFKDKSGGIYLVTHQIFCFILFCSLETRANFEKLVFPDLLLPVVAGVLLLLSHILILVTVMMDPGVQPKKSEQHQQLESNYYNKHRKGPSLVLRPMAYYGETILGNYCFDCKHFKHSRTVHCRFCDRCVVRYDHHCNVLGTCVGLRNFPFYFFLMIFVLLYYLYITSVSVFLLVRKLLEEKPTVFQLLQSISIVWIMIITVVVMLASGMGALILFPCVYLYITALDKTARELFFVIETRGNHHCRCYKVLKSVQQDEKRGCVCGFFQILGNLRRYLCTCIPPSLLKESNYYVVCDLDELLERDRDKMGGDPEKALQTASALMPLEEQAELLQKIPVERNIPCCEI